MLFVTVQICELLIDFIDWSIFYSHPIGRPTQPKSPKSHPSALFDRKMYTFIPIFTISSDQVDPRARHDDGTGKMVHTDKQWDLIMSADKFNVRSALRYEEQVGFGDEDHTFVEMIPPMVSGFLIDWPIDWFI